MEPNELQIYINTNEQQLVNELLGNIGNPNAHIREGVTFQLFTLLLHHQFLSIEVVNQIAEYIVEQQYLFLNIDSPVSDAVFTRSASALWLTSILKSEKYSKNLPNTIFSLILQQSSRYLMQEKDSRGYVNDENGWADAIGAAAELCYSCINNDHFDIKETSNLLQAISKALWNNHVFVNNEDERFIKMIMGLIHQDVDEQLLIEWVEQIFDKLEFYSYNNGYTQQWFIARTNILQLMKTLYFHLKFSHKHDQLRAVTSIFIQKWLKI